MLDANPSQRVFICSALAELGLSQVLPAANLSEARRLGSEGPVDLCIVDSRSLVDGSTGSQAKIAPNPFDAFGTPAILIAEDTMRATLEAAAAAGYRAVLGLPVVPRLLYRRIGSILQKVRRIGRQLLLAIAATIAIVDASIPDIEIVHEPPPGQSWTTGPSG